MTNPFKATPAKSSVRWSRADRGRAAGCTSASGASCRQARMARTTWLFLANESTRSRKLKWCAPPIRSSMRFRTLRPARLQTYGHPCLSWSSARSLRRRCVFCRSGQQCTEGERMKQNCKTCWRSCPSTRRAAKRPATKAKRTF
jgi:hypothetical protein